MNYVDVLTEKKFSDYDAILEAQKKMKQKHQKTIPTASLEKLKTKLVKPFAGLTPYTGPWGRSQAFHLLRRTTFGATKADVDTLLLGTLEDAINTLLANPVLPNPPLNVSEGDKGVPFGETWVNAPYVPEYEQYRRYSLVSWWTGQMIHQSLSLNEKMTLFWHNHFVTELAVVTDSRFSYKYCNLLRTHALGNFKTLAKLITVDPAMLVYLNGTDNVVGNPNENYARELFELFTIGKGEQVAPGDYTTYTEDDVIAAAKVLTGWVARRSFIDAYFVPSRHDTTDKQFSHRFNDQIISDNGANEYDDLIEMIFAKAETAKHICRKIYNWFLYYNIDATIEADVIEPMANILIANNYDIKPVLTAFFKSEHFFDALSVGCLIKNPCDFTLGLIRQFNIALPGPMELEKQYDVWSAFYGYNGLLEMLIASPPQVAGWAPYYQAPQYHEIWINSVTTPARKYLSDALTVGATRNGYLLKLDAIAFAEQTSTPSDCNVLVDEFVEMLFPFPVTTKQRDFLKEVLRPGVPDFTWTVEWLDYKANPGDMDKKNAIDLKLRNLIITMLAMAEYQLS